MASRQEGRTGPRKDNVPDIVGEVYTDANTQITNAGFDVGTVTTENIDDASGSLGTGNLNKVKTQTPSANYVYPLKEDVDYVYHSPYFPPFFPPFFPPYFPPFFPPFFPPYFPPFFPPFFPPYFPPFFPPYFPPYFPPFFPPFFPPYFPPFFPPYFPPHFT